MEMNYHINLQNSQYFLAKKQIIKFILLPKFGKKK